MEGRSPDGRLGDRWKVRCGVRGKNGKMCRRVLDHVVRAPDGRFLPSKVVYEKVVYEVEAFEGVIRPPYLPGRPPVVSLILPCDEHPSRQPRCKGKYEWNLDRFSAHAAAAIAAGKVELIAGEDV